MEYSEYGPLASLIATWETKGFTGENRAPDENREVKNTKFRQKMTFTPMGDTEHSL